MGAEVHGLATFYGSAPGAAASRLVAQRLRALWPSLRGLGLLGIGHATPYMPLWEAEAARAIALTPAQLGPPPAGPGARLAAAEDALPFPDLSFDRVLLVHGLEMSENVRRLLREIWRVLKDDGRLMVVAPNRRGIWAHSEHTPFGHGQPYSPGQVTRLLERHLFRVERRDSALYTPPYAPFLRAGNAWERCGRAIWPARYAGLAIVEAQKDLLAAMPAGAVAARRVVMPA
ncbi:class I SAM-dependent methyltransferase [Roseomonas alkaliterrae]|uniref:SAM-dependent methyltransferase n=1 Tax=Neoroseomonas alkaliterrae TaxID=1452450 RepID=A0A840Y605_9PROT|nr:class I SAM-dependent methyltransferase [Neoroseomonas alkaliterrae]MBB5689523.1 SAM-dependent methyltransferase [Neoroseomonas alkaliterrae]MBR0676557.1 class I SAM-dependent methyltransferase [Neoroseomonas alkaliterrae]